MKPSHPSQEFLNALRKAVDYNSTTGAITWRIRGAETFNSHIGKTAEAAASAFNKTFAGRPAFSCRTSHGYLSGTFSNKRIYAHHVAWFFANGQWPSLVIDHINGDKADNRICNLRHVSHSVNLRNAIKPSHNTSGHIGIYKLPSKKCPWGATLMVDKRKIHLGSFPTIEEAINARIKASKEYGFTDQHGR